MAMSSTLTSRCFNLSAGRPHALAAVPSSSKCIESKRMLNLSLDKYPFVKMVTLGMGEGEVNVVKACGLQRVT